MKKTNPPVPQDVLDPARIRHERRECRTYAGVAHDTELAQVHVQRVDDLLRDEVVAAIAAEWAIAANEHADIIDWCENGFLAPGFKENKFMLMARQMIRTGRACAALVEREP